MSDEEMRIKVAKDLAYDKCGGYEPRDWRYDGTHAAGNQMLRTVNVVMASLRKHGWNPAGAFSNGEPHGD